MFIINIINFILHDDKGDYFPILKKIKHFLRSSLFLSGKEIYIYSTLFIIRLEKLRKKS